MGSNEKIVVFGPALPLNLAPMWVAHDKGFFKEEGLEVDLRPVQGSFSSRPAARRRFARCWKIVTTSTAR